MNDRDRLKLIAHATARMESSGVPSPRQLFTFLESVRIVATQTAEFIELNRAQIEEDLGIPFSKITIG